MSVELPETGAAFDRAYSGEVSHFVDPGGRHVTLDIAGWRAEATATDLLLFVEPCTGPTLDVGCGPGRLVTALHGAGRDVVGIDTSSAAVALGRDRAATVVWADIFGPVPREGRWEFALLADGNVGIGGDPARLLSRMRQVIGEQGRVLVELDPDHHGVIAERRRLLVDGHLTAEFDWAVVGTDAIDELAQMAGLHRERWIVSGGRQVAVLAPDLTV